MTKHVRITGIADGAGFPGFLSSADGMAYGAKTAASSA